MCKRKTTPDKILPISSFFQKAEGFLAAETWSTKWSIKGFTRETKDSLKVDLMTGSEEEASFWIHRDQQEIAYVESGYEQVLSVFSSILNLKEEKKSNFEALTVIKAFIEGQEEHVEVYLATRNKIYIEKEEEVELYIENLFERPVFLMEKFQEKTETELGLLDCIFIRFKNGETFKFSEVIKHPRAALLPWEMVAEQNTKSVSWGKQVLRPEAAACPVETTVADRLICSLEGLVEEKRLKLFLLEKPYEDRGYSLSYRGVFKISKEIKTVSVKDVLFEKADLHLLDRSLSLDLDYSIDLSKARMMDSVFHLKESGELFITKEDEIREKIKDLFSADKLKFKLKSLSFTVEEDSLKKTISYSESFYQSPIEKIKKLEEILPLKINHDLDLKVADPGRLSLMFSNVVPSQVELRYGVGGEEGNHLDPDSYVMERILKVLLGLKGGVAAYLGKDAANIAIKGNKRLAELKLLKSSGFFTFILMEVMETTKKGEDLDREDLWTRLDKAVVKLSHSESDQAEDVVSSFFVEYVNDAVESLFERENYEVLQVVGSEIVTVSAQKVVFDFLGPFLGSLTNYYRTKVFTLDSFQNFEIKPQQSIKNGMSIELHSPCPLNIGSFIEKNDCVLNEEKIKVLKENSFRAELKVVEDSSSDKKIDWFELNPKYYFDGVEISEEEAKAFRANSIVRYNGQVFFIPEKEVPVVKWLNYFWDRVSLDKKASSADKAEDTGEPSFYRSHVLDILALRQAGIPVDGGERWQAIAREYDSIDEETEFSLEGFSGKLKAFQTKGVSWLCQLYSLGLGGVLADDMGLGKTVQMLAFLNHLKNTGDEKRLNLVVVPTSLIHNWRSETEKFTPETEVFTYKSGLQDDLKKIEEGLVLVTYGLLTEHQELFQEKKWDVIIFDEAQQLKNIKSMRSQAARGIKAKAKICLTGTPMENHYGEFFSLVDLSVPGSLGDHAAFMKVYGPRKVSAGAVGKKEIDYLKLKSKPLVLRRTKDEVLKELPDKTESIVKIDFDEKQREIYRNVALSWSSKVQKLMVDQGESKSQIQMFAALMKLRQVCSCPDVVVGAEYNVLSPKLSQVVERTEELLTANKSVLIFTNFISTLDSIKGELKKRNLDVLSITGKDSQKKREQTLEAFNGDGERALVMTLKTGGVGLNLTKANYIIHVEPWWNPAAENQGTDRAHRIGQKQAVHVYRYIMTNSIEEKIQLLKESKQEAFNMLLAETDSEDSTGESASFKGGSGLTKKDFEYLLS